MSAPPSIGPNLSAINLGNPSTEQSTAKTKSSLSFLEDTWNTCFNLICRILENHLLCRPSIPLTDPPDIPFSKIETSCPIEQTQAILFMELIKGVIFEEKDSIGKIYGACFSLYQQKADLKTRKSIAMRSLREIDEITSKLQAFRVSEENKTTDGTNSSIDAPILFQDAKENMIHQLNLLKPQISATETTFLEIEKERKKIDESIQQEWNKLTLELKERENGEEFLEQIQKVARFLLPSHQTNKQ